MSAGKGVPRATAAIVALLGLAMAIQGAQLLVSGGTPYFLTAGLLMTVSALQLWRLSPSGFFIYAAVLLLTLGWAVYEAGIEFWLVGSRIWIVGTISLWLCSVWVRRPLWNGEPPKLFSLRTVQACAVATVLVLGSMTVNLFTNPAIELPGTTYGLPQNSVEWDAYGANNAGTRYVPHDQINIQNVRKLEKVWETETHRPGTFNGTPIQIGNGLYLCTSQNVIISLDADTGVERWRFDPENETTPVGPLGACRGVTYAQIPDRPKGDHCAERIIIATTDSRMIAVDMLTGLPCEEFGKGGEISLLAGMGDVKPHYYFVTSPPTLASGALVVGGYVLDNQEIEEPSGVVRGYDPVTGALLWAWDIGREGQSVMPPEGDYYTRGTPNVWSLSSADDDLGLVYVPTGNATPDYFGGHRTEAMDRFASSVVAIDAKTGLTRWHFQTTHHDVWDYDVPSQPTLVDLTLDGVVRKAVIVPTKRAEIFVLDRETGEPITEVTEKRVPQSDLPEERTSPTQPFSTGMPSFAHPEIRERDLFGITPFDQMACRQQFLGMRYDGPMTPPSIKGTLHYPSPLGGQNWGSVAVDEERQLMVVSTTHVPFYVRMIPRADDLPTSEDGWFAPGYGIGGPQRGTPYAARVQMFSSLFGLPCLKPPYGEIAVVDLTKQEVVWRRAMGPLALGFPYTAGSFITAGGLIFNAGVTDGQLRAIDVETGDTVWQDGLVRSSDATPMSYVSPATGRQYVLVTVPGERLAIGISHASDLLNADTSGLSGGRVIAYALPAE